MNDSSVMEDTYILEIKKYKERLNIALKAAKICVFEVDLARQLYTFFENAEDIFGVSGESILKDVQPYSKLEPAAYQQAASAYFSHPDDFKVIDEAFKSILSGQSTTYQARMKAGGSDFVWCKIDVTPIMKNNIPIKMIGVITDISNLKAKTDKLENAVKLDSFTGLYNKKHSIHLIHRALDKHANQQHALILIDIDNFKSLNDIRGHAVGDTIIESVSKALKKHFRKNDVIGRFGGDEFILFVQDIPNSQWLIEKLQKLVRFEEDTCSCTNSIGISIFPQDGTEFAPLFEKADEALYQSKLFKETYTFFSEFNM